MSEGPSELGYIADLGANVPESFVRTFVDLWDLNKPTVRMIALRTIVASETQALKLADNAFRLLPLKMQKALLERSWRLARRDRVSIGSGFAGFFGTRRKPA